MNILVVGIGEVPHIGCSFRTALEELGHVVSFVDERQAFGWLDRHATRSVVWRLRHKLPTGVSRFNQLLIDTALQSKPDIILSVKGSYIAPDTLKYLRESTRAILINYSTDHPFNPAASNKYVVGALPFWDVYATPRRDTIPNLKLHCKGSVIYLPFGYDPLQHFPERFAGDGEAAQFRSDVVFIGVCDQARMPLLESVAEKTGVDVRLYGGGRYGYSRILRERHRGFANGRAYRCALGGSKIALSLLRHTNLDTHVMRTFEVPACGAFMLAERTDEHLAMFQEDKEAAFFTGLDEVLDKIKYYLKHDSQRLGIARAGYERVINGHHTYKDRVRSLLGYARQ